MDELLNNIYKKKLIKNKSNQKEVCKTITSNNPAFIMRNHLVEQIIQELLTDKKDLDQNIFVKVRSTGSLLEAKVDLKDNNTANVHLLNPEDGISPGQACVFYSKDQYGHRVLGGGWIDKTEKQSYPHN